MAGACAALVNSKRGPGSLGITCSYISTSHQTLITACPENNSKMTDPQKQPSKKRKSTGSVGPKMYTIRSLPYTYLHVSLLANDFMKIDSSKSNTAPTIDEITVRTHLTSALEQFLGAMGAGIPIDILKIDGKDTWIRIPREDGPTVIEAINAWNGPDGRWLVRGNGAWLGGLAMGKGHDLFET